jgi:hypothetical protein
MKDIIIQAARDILGTRKKRYKGKKLIERNE